MKEVDEKYDPDDDSSDEEAIAYKAKLAEAAKEAEDAAATEAEKVASAQGKRKK